MRSLVVAGEYPWPSTSGSRLRLQSVLAGLAGAGPVDLFAAVPAVRRDVDPPDPAVGVDRVAWTAVDDRAPAGAGRLARAARTGLPFEVPRHDRRAAAGLARFVTGRYDVVWYFGIRPWLAAGGLVPAPAVLDLVDLEDAKIAARLAASSRPGRPAARARWLAARGWSGEEIRRWQRLHRRASTSVAATVVCSDLDATRARATGAVRVVVVPNAYPRPGRPVGRDVVGRPPTVLFQGTLRYPPNADGARFLVGEVAPRLWSERDDARIRLVGPSAPGLGGLDDRPRVTVVGPVADMVDELAAADVVIVPVRFGSGTRLKILEAFAHRVPVVSTTLAAEGLDAVDGEHLLVADDAEGLARACARLLDPSGPRGRLVEAAERLYLDRYRQEVVGPRVAGVADAVARGVPVSP